MTNFLWLYLSHNFTLYCLRLRPIKYVSCIIFHYRSVFKLIARHLFLHLLLFFFFFFLFRWFPVPEDSVTIVVDSLDRGLMNSNFFFLLSFSLKGNFFLTDVVHLSNEREFDKSPAICHSSGSRFDEYSTCYSQNSEILTKYPSDSYFFSLG